jgi:hypothetical protein
VPHVAIVSVAAFGVRDNIVQSTSCIEVPFAIVGPAVSAIHGITGLLGRAPAILPLALPQLGLRSHLDFSM